jgi:hypothetical protein
VAGDVSADVEEGNVVSEVADDPVVPWSLVTLLCDARVRRIKGKKRPQTLLLMYEVFFLFVARNF